MALRRNLRQFIYLLGDYDTQIYGNKLLSKEQALKVLLFNIRVVKLSTRESAKLVVRVVKVFWDKARLSIQKENRCIDKLLVIYDEWTELQKHKTRPTNRQKEEHFSSRLKNLFDISHGNILENIDEMRRTFLENQRRDGCAGYINDIEGFFKRIERKEEWRNEVLSRRQSKSQMNIDLIDSFVELSSNEGPPSPTLTQGSIDAYSNISFNNDREEDEAGPPICKRSRGNVNIFNDKVVTVLDKCEVSDRDAVHLVGAIAEALNVDLRNLILNRSLIRAHRQKVRAERADRIKEVFQTEKLDALVLHWDGKLLIDITKRSMVDRLPVVVTNGEIEKLLGVPALENSKGVTQANAIHEVLRDWGLCESVKALCCDTTASNLGNKNGAAAHLESLLQTSFLLLPCRHHIFELVLRSVFEMKLPLTGPNVPLFKNFHEAWNKIYKTSYKSGINDEYVRRILTPNHIERIKSFTQKALETVQQRDDYKEFLELCLIFIGSVPSTKVTFIYPGAFHHARWMAKAIYCLKLFIFRDQYPLTDEERLAVRDTSIFAVMLYVEAWFTAPLASVVPNNDLQFLKNLYNYKSIDEGVSNATLKKFSKHLWYLNAETVALSFFEENVPFDIKHKMVSELSPYDEIDDFFPKWIQINLKHIVGYCDKEIDHFVSARTLNFFRRFGIDKEFLKLDPSVWSQNESYAHGLKIVKHLKVINDVAERGIHLFTDYNAILTRDEQQKQFILPIVNEYPKNHPDAEKKTLLKNLCSEN